MIFSIATTHLLVSLQDEKNLQLHNIYCVMHKHHVGSLYNNFVNFSLFVPEF